MCNQISTLLAPVVIDDRLRDADHERRLRAPIEEDRRTTGHRTLVVANRTAATPELLKEIARRASERPTAFVLLIPDATSRKVADWTLDAALKVVRRVAAGPAGLRPVDVQGRVGGADPLASIRQALTDEQFDDVIISTLPQRRSRWLRHDLPAQVQRLGVPVAVITPPEQRRMTLQDVAAIGGAGMA